MSKHKDNYVLDDESIIKPELEIMRDPIYSKSIEDPIFDIFKFTNEILLGYPSYMNSILKRNQDKLDDNIKFMKLLFNFYIKNNEDFSFIKEHIKLYDLFYDESMNLRKTIELVIPNPYLDNFYENKIPMNKYLCIFIRSLIFSSDENDKKLSDFIRNILGINYMDDSKIFSIIFSEKLNIEKNIKVKSEDLVGLFYYLYIIRILLPFNTRNFLNRKFAIISNELLVLINIKVIHCIEVFKSFMLTLECLIRLIFLFWTCSHLQSIR